MLKFDYVADRNYFVSLLAKGDDQLFEKKFAVLFNFSDPIVKRQEFNNIRKQVQKQLIKKYV